MGNQGRKNIFRGKVVGNGPNTQCIYQLVKIFPLTRSCGERKRKRKGVEAQGYPLLNYSVKNLLDCWSIVIMSFAFTFLDENNSKQNSIWQFLIFLRINQQFQFLMSYDSNKLRSQSSKQHKKYEKFANDIYSCIREKQTIMKRCSTPDTMDNFPRLLQQQKKSGLSTIQQIAIDAKNMKVSNSQVKSIKFKNFLNALDEHQKKVSTDNMNLLGLQVKKISYCEKAKRASEKHLVDFFDQNFYSSARQQQNSLSRSQMRRTINCEVTEDLSCQRIGINHRQSYAKNKGTRVTSRGNFIRTRQKSRVAGKSEQKRRVSSQFNNPIYDNRINSYRQLIFRLNIAHGAYVEMEKDQNPQFVFKNQMRYKAWVGSGNNGNLIKSLIKRRFWWVLLEQKSMNANFIWTQLKINDFFSSQPPSSIWMKDTAKFWGRPPQIQESFKTVKKLIKRKSANKQVTQQQLLYKIFTQQQTQKNKQYSKKLSNKPYSQRRQFLQLAQFKNEDCKMHNHLINNFYLGNKKALFYNLKQYYDLIGENAFTRIPLTFHIKKGFKDIQYKRFLAYYKKRQAAIKKQEKQDTQKGEKKKMRNVWIVKPGELTNRGNGITVIDEVYELNNIIKRQAHHDNGAEKTFIVQLYLDRPLLYQKRKFDIRHYMLITHIHGLMRAYWYKEGYIRTSSYQFDIQNFERQIHLTNDAVQKYMPAYGKYQQGNKLSYAQFQRYLDATYPKKNYNFQEQILPQMKHICLDAVKSSYLKLSPQRHKHNFQFFGLDFMIDDNFKPWLIQINTNPCLQLSSPLLARIIPQAVDQALRLSLDIVFPPPCHYPNTSKHLAPEAGLQNLNYQLIFDQKRDGGQLRALYKKSTDNLLQQIGNISQDQTYQDDGKDIAIDQLL